MKEAWRDISDFEGLYQVSTRTVGGYTFKRVQREDICIS